MRKGAQNHFTARGGPATHDRFLISSTTESAHLAGVGWNELELRPNDTVPGDFAAFCLCRPQDR
jgi:hypothetical protein